MLQKYHGRKGKRYRKFRSLSWPKRIALIFVDILILCGAHAEFMGSWPAPALFVSVAIIYNRGGLFRNGHLSAICYFILLVSAIDQSVINFGMFPLRAHTLVGVGLIIVLPLLLATAGARYVRYVPPQKLFLLCSIVTTAVGVNIMIAMPSKSKLDTSALPSYMHHVFRLEKPKGIKEVPRMMLLDDTRHILYLSYRYRIFTSSAYNLAALERIHTATGNVETIHLKGAEVIGMALDKAPGYLYLSLVRRPELNPGPEHLPKRELVVLDPEGHLVARKEIPGHIEEYFDFISVRGDHVILTNNMYDMSCDKLLERITIRPRAHPVAGWWTFTSAATTHDAMFRTYAGPPLKGLLLSRCALEKLDVSGMESLKRIKDGWSGYYAVQVDPEHGILATIPHWGDSPAIRIYDRDLQLKRTIPVPEVIRAFAADFPRDRVATVGYISGNLTIYRFSDGQLLGTMNIGSGSRCLMFGPGGELYHLGPVLVRY